MFSRVSWRWMPALAWAALLVSVMGGEAALGAGIIINGDINANGSNATYKTGTATRIDSAGNATLTAVTASGNLAANGGLTVGNNKWLNISDNTTISFTRGSIASDRVFFGTGQDVYNRLQISGNRMTTSGVAISNGMIGTRCGILVDGQGKVAVGNTDNFNSFAGFTVNPIQGIFQVGSASPTVMGQNNLNFNAYYDPTVNFYKYYGSNDYRYASTQFPAGLISTNVVGGNLIFGAAEPGSSGSPVTFKGMILTPTGELGVGFSDLGASPVAGLAGGKSPVTGTVKLDVRGAVALRNINATSASVGGYIFASEGRMHVRDANGDLTTFSPHDDPREKFPQAQSSFGDAAVPLPFSMHHENDFVGKGVYVDMSKMIKYIEQRMQSELGAEAGRLVYVYDLPAEQRKTAEDYEVDAVLERLQQLGPIKVTPGKDGAIPEEAVETVDEMTRVVHEVSVPERTLDLSARRIVTTMKMQTVVEMVKTGRKTQRLKPGWSFAHGELYRPPTLSDVDLNAVTRTHPKLPQWVLTRMKGGQSTGQSVSSLVDEIKKRLAAATVERKTQVAAIED